MVNRTRGDQRVDGLRAVPRLGLGPTAHATSHYASTARPWPRVEARELVGDSLVDSSIRSDFSSPRRLQPPYDAVLCDLSSHELQPSRRSPSGASGPA